MKNQNTTERACKHHGLTTYILEGSGYYRCRQCRMDAVSRRRKKVKITLVTEKGGACQSCGYDRCVDALEFHHVDEDQKDFGIAENGVTKSLERLRVEAAKCVLLCANCHREVHAGLRECPPLLIPV